MNNRLKNESLNRLMQEMSKKKPSSRKKNPNDSGMIVDPMGQYAYPGQNTRIPSNEITMQGVPYPVYGISDLGQEQMMYPGQDYQFDGAEYVDEYPMMRGGGSTYNGGVWYRDGGMPCYDCGGTTYMNGGDIPNYMQDMNPMYNFGGYFPQGPRFDYGGTTMDGTRMGMIDVYEEGGIHIDPSKKGTFTAAATKNNMGVQEFANKVLSAPEGRYSPAMRKKANFAKNAAGWKKQEGGIVEGQIIDVTPDMLQQLQQGGYTFEIIND